MVYALPRAGSRFNATFWSYHFYFFFLLLNN
jgi:hypothetical protein